MQAAALAAQQQELRARLEAFQDQVAAAQAALGTREAALDAREAALAAHAEREAALQVGCSMLLPAHAALAGVGWCPANPEATLAADGSPTSALRSATGCLQQLGQVAV